MHRFLSDTEMSRESVPVFVFTTFIKRDLYKFQSLILAINNQLPIFFKTEPNNSSESLGEVRLLVISLNTEARI